MLPIISRESAILLGIECVAERVSTRSVSLPQMWEMRAPSMTGGFSPSPLKIREKASACDVFTPTSPRLSKTPHPFELIHVGRFVARGHLNEDGANRSRCCQRSRRRRVRGNVVRTPGEPASGARPPPLRRFGGPPPAGRNHVRRHSPWSRRSRRLHPPSPSASAITRSTGRGSSGRLPGAHAGAGPDLRPHRRVRLVPDGAARRASSTGPGWTRRSSPWRAERLSRAVHADRDAAGLARPEAPGDPAGRARRSCARLRLAQALRPASPIYREESPAHYHARSPSATGSIRPSSAGRPTTSSAVTTRRALRARQPRRFPRRGWKRATATLDALNEAWGNVFWSQEYSAWDQIDAAEPDGGGAEPVARARLLPLRQRHDRRFQEEQVEILRELSPGRWITHNFMRLSPDFDHYRAGGVPRLRLAGTPTRPVGRALTCRTRRRCAGRGPATPT